MPDATLNQIRAYFGIESAQKFAAEWRQLTDTDKMQIKAGIGNGTYNY
jgi:hypothetical protein